MRTTAWIGALSFGLAVTSGPARGDSNAGKAEVVLTVVVENAKGRVLCGVYERDGWLKRPLKRTAATIRGNTASCRFGALKPGTYAAGAFQDTNSNGTLDRNWMGLPREPWCVTRGSRGRLSPPSFASASFSVNDAAVRLNCRAS
jgi:uncharacterized protein (DUF2141 family)